MIWLFFFRVRNFKNVYYFVFGLFLDSYVLFLFFYLWYGDRGKVLLKFLGGCSLKVDVKFV